MNTGSGRWFLLALLAVLAVSQQGCTQKAWFQGFIEGQKYQCNKLTGRERTDCLEAINQDYDRYQTERMEYLQRQK